MPLRDRFALGLAGITVGALPIFAAIAAFEGTRRTVDVPVLWLAGLLQLGMVLTWIFVPRLPRWIVAGWGLILASTGLGLVIAGPVIEGAGSVTPWGFFGLLIVGIVTMILAAVHSPADQSSIA